MNLIYKHAALTIIATGDDAMERLYGVTPRKQFTQHSVKLGRIQLVSTIDSIGDIQASPWNSRGWTFQEGLLSTRRLVFGPRQVYFQCQSIHCLECLRFPLEAMPEPVESAEYGISSALQQINFGRFFPEQGVGHGLDAFNHRLMECLKRSLSDDSDILNRFKGILKELERESTAFYSFVGPPILARELSMPAMLVQVLSWPTSLEGIKRRRMFPSWSWTGWTQPMDVLLQVQFDE